MTAECQDVLVRRLIDKIRTNADDIVIATRRTTVDGADVVVISYGITSRVARGAIDLARKEGLKVGMRA
jgi:2-oxoglutarate ferredoxin oxidoreductase subunit alpha